MKLNETRALRQAQIAQYRQSGKSAEEWCKAHHVNFHTLRYWITKLNKTDPLANNHQSSSWVTLTPFNNPSPASSTSSGLTLRKGAFVLEVETGCDPGLLRQIVQILASL